MAKPAPTSWGQRVQQLLVHAAEAAIAHDQDMIARLRLLDDGLHPLVALVALVALIGKAVERL